MLDHIDNERRELSAKGARQATGLGQFLRNGGVRFDAAYSRLLIRARQTAGLILDETNKGSHLEFQLAGALVNATPVEDFVGWLKSWPPVEHLLLVGHEPTMSQRVAIASRHENSHVPQRLLDPGARHGCKRIHSLSGDR